METITLNSRISLNYLRKLKQSGWKIYARAKPPNCGGRRQLEVFAAVEDAEELNRTIKAGSGTILQQMTVKPTCLRAGGLCGCSIGKDQKREKNHEGTKGVRK